MKRKINNPMKKISVSIYFLLRLDPRTLFTKHLNHLIRMENYHAAYTQKEPQVEPGDADFKGRGFGFVLFEHDPKGTNPDTDEKQSAQGLAYDPEYLLRKPFQSLRNDVDYDVSVAGPGRGRSQKDRPHTHKT